MLLSLSLSKDMCVCVCVNKKDVCSIHECIM